MHLKIALLTFLFTTIAKAFIPPLPAILHEVFDGRQRGPVEVVFRHRIGNEILDERILADGGKYWIIWRGAGFSQPTGGTWERQNYYIGDKTLPSRSALFLKYFGSASPDYFRDGLLNEQFVRRDQLMVFKPGWGPRGDPQTWDLRENYLRHPDIFLQRTRAGVAIAMVGLEEGVLRKAVFFDKALKGIRRLEWRDGNEVSAWNFENFTGSTKQGTYPKRMSFEVNSEDVITSEVISVRPLKDRYLTEFRTSWRQASTNATLPEKAEAAFSKLISFR